MRFISGCNGQKHKQRGSSNLFLRCDIFKKLLLQIPIWDINAIQNSRIMVATLAKKNIYQKQQEESTQCRMFPF